ncbi:NAD(P)/FAD-dependent oxidoreductase [Dactylosporangium sp. NPDC048998]|uniref:NAD(P)/FAD-dependent oxidoreductase n=1 Tax=Dactylosporangium sp. NPDC048998 TaxID=3363976 RepID=UPI0037178D14
MNRVVIVGGGIAGVSTAAALRAGGYEGALTLVDAGEFPYDRPPLSKEYLAGKADLRQIALQPPEWYSAQAVELLPRTWVTALRPERVELRQGPALAADRVVLATGGLAVRPPIPGIDDLRIHTLRTADDADRLREVLAGEVRLLVVGGGLIGAEVASTAAGMGCEVVLADPVAAPLADAVGPETAAWLHAQHETWGIRTVTTGVVAFRATAGGVQATLAGEDRPRTFDAVLIGVGMTPDARLMPSPAVLTVGDAAGAGHWEAAQRDGQRAAATLLGHPAAEPSAPWFWSDRHGRHVEVVGRMADADRTVIRGSHGDAPFAVFGLRGRYVVGAVAVDDSTAVRTARRLIDRDVAVDAECLADPSTNLRGLLKGPK